MGTPKIRWLVQESLQKIAQGPDALMQWAREHSGQIDSASLGMLGKMEEYSRRNGNEEMARTFHLVKACFDKMFDLPEQGEPKAITRDNFQQVWGEASRHLQQGKPKKALAAMNDLSLFLSQNPDLEFAPLLHANMGIAYAQLNQKSKALEHLRRARSEVSEPARLEKILANLGTIYRDAGDWTQAMDSYRDALKIARERRDLTMQIGYLNNLALICMENRDLDQAIAHQEENCRIAEQVSDPAILQDCLTRMALLHQLRGESEKCKELCERALKLNTVDTGESDGKNE